MEDQNDREKRYPGLPIEREEDRNRLYFVADTAEKRSASLRDGKTEERSADPQPGSHRELSDRTARRCPSRLLAKAETSQRWTVRKEHSRGRTPEVGGCSGFDRGELGDTDSPGPSRLGEDGGQGTPQGRIWGRPGDHGIVGDSESKNRKISVYQWRQEQAGSEPRGAGGPCNGFWSDAVWLPCRDGKARPVGVEFMAKPESVRLQKPRDKSGCSPESSGEVGRVEFVADAGGKRRQQITGSAPRHEEADGGKGRDRGESDCDHQPSGDSQDSDCSRAEGSVKPEFLKMADGLAEGLGLVRLQNYPNRPHEERLIISPLIQKGKARVGRLRGYGNAIVGPVAEEFIKAYMEVSHD